MKVSRIIQLRNYNSCRHCGSKSNLTIDHIWPKSRGGLDHITNYQLLCYDCNIRKGDLLPSQNYIEAVPLYEILTAINKGHRHSREFSKKIIKFFEPLETFHIFDINELNRIESFLNSYHISIINNVKIGKYTTSTPVTWFKTFNPEFSR